MTATTCRHWIGTDAAGRMCGAPLDGTSTFCRKHWDIELRRAEKAVAKARTAADRAEATWRLRNVPRLPQMRVSMERAEAEYARRTSAHVSDRAAVGGAVHPSIVRAQHSKLSDANVSRVVELEKLIAALRKDIARAEAVR